MLLCMIGHVASVVGHTKGATNEKQSITHGLGMQISCSLGAKKAKKSNIWKTTK